MSQPDWADGLRLKLEELVDGYVVKGARQEDVFDAIVEEVGRLRAALELDPDPAEDSSVMIEEWANNRS
ncbi:hypothetical protein SB748_27360 [Rhizobium sp. SIMBA_035]